MDLQAADPLALLRMLLLFAHVLAVIAAGAAIAFGDYALFAHPRVDGVLLQRAGAAVSVALLALWLSGAAIIWLDTGFDPARLADSPKLLAKLSVVTLLTLNGIALHRVAFRRLARPGPLPAPALYLPAMLGAVSLVSWLFAAFIGLAGPATPLLGYAGFMGLYGLALALGIGTALWLIQPRLACRLGAASAQG